MTYIGNPQGTGFSKIDSQQFSGTGSATAFTMSCLLYTSDAADE